MKGLLDFFMLRRNLSDVALFVLLGLLLTGCTKTVELGGTKTGGTAYDPSKVIAVTTEVSALSGPAGTRSGSGGAAAAGTRGTPIDNVSQMTTLGLFCSYTNQNTYAPASDAPGYMFDEQLELHADGFWYYSGTPVMWWGASYPSTVPGAGYNAADHYTFFAYAPFATGVYDATGNPTGNGITVTSAFSTAGTPTLSYAVPTNVLNQPDLMLALPRKDLHPTGHPVALQLKHALTAVGFTIVGNGEKVTGISISGVSTSGNLVMDGTAIAWTGLNAPQTTDFSASIAFDSGESYMTATSTQTSLITGDGYLMMVPQTFDTTLRAPAPKPLMTLSFADGTTRLVDMTNFPQWTAGERITYNIILTPAGTLSVSPSNLVLDFHAQTPAIQTVNVVAMTASGSDDSTAPWTLTSDQPWLQFTLDPGGASPTQTLNGFGSQNVYLVTTANPDVTIRQATISLGSALAVNVSQLVDVNNALIVPQSTTLPAGTAYIGAFWRASETGERVITIPVGANPTNTGTWTAQVVWFDSQWDFYNGDGIVLSTSSSTDGGIGTASPDNAENHQVTDGTISPITGTVGAGGNITFRLGLQKSFAFFNAAGNPARYAVVLISFGTGQYWNLYLRQGEGADYVMRNSDQVSSGGLAARTMCVKFSPYNLTAAHLNAQVDISGATPAVNPGIFTQYPTQAGAFFQWANLINVRYAYDPITPGVPAGITWDSTDPNSYWTDASNLAATHETCPSGYRRATDGLTNTADTGPTMTSSESRQSLYLNPQLGNNNNSINNSVWGYYADGFFDRRPITGGPAGSTSPGSNSSVSAGDDNIAHNGMLFFNPATNASLFFPAAGYRYSNGPLYNAGTYGYYWTSSSFETTNSWHLYIFNIHSSQNTSNRCDGFTVRCVKN